MKTLFNKLCIKHFGVSPDKIKKLLKYSFDEVENYSHLTLKEKEILDSNDFHELKRKLK